MSLTVDAKKLRDALARLAPTINAELAANLKNEAKALIEKANELVPVKSGQLRDSAFYALLSNDGQVVKAVAGYMAEYAPWVHENASREQVVTERPGQFVDIKESHYKWFERAFNAFERDYQARAIELIKGALARSVETVR